MDIKNAVIILAAGMSKRMGVTKPLLPVGGVTAVLRCVREADAAGITDIFVVTGHQSELVHSAVQNAFAGVRDIRLIYNDRYEDGMFSSVHAGVTALGDGYDGFFILPVDCCAVSRGTYISINKAFSQLGGSCTIRPVHCGRRGHPPMIPGRYREPLLSYGGDSGLKGFLRTLPASEIQIDDPGILLDMDTPDDYSRLLGYLGLPAYPQTAAECDAILQKYNVPEEIRDHGKHVAEIALKIARTIDPEKSSIDRNLLASACLLHDICRHCGGGHAREGMMLLLKEGFPEAAILVGGHMDLPEAAERAASAKANEMEILYLADKLCRRGKVCPIEETRRCARERFEHDKKALAAADKRLKAAQDIADRIGGYSYL